jgi:hypothetical protein
MTSQNTFTRLCCPHCIFAPSQRKLIKNSHISSHMPLLERLKRLRHGEAHSLPEWTSLPVKLGSYLGSLSPDSEAVFIAIVPDRRLFATLCATSYVSAISHDLLSGGKSNEYYQELCNLPSGTPVTLRKEERIYYGYLKQKKGDWIGVQVEGEEGGSTERLVPPGRSLRIGMLDGEVDSLPTNQRGHQLRGNREFIDALLPDVDPLGFLSQSSHDCMIIGLLRRLKEEADAEGFAVEQEGKMISGCLQDILRIGELGGKYENYRCTLHKRSGNTPPNTDNPPGLLIYDGALAFMKWRHIRSPSDRLAILDTHDPAFPQAVDALRQDAQMRGEDINLSDLGSLPSGVEILGYHR